MEYREQFLSPNSASFQQHSSHHHHRTRSFKARSRPRDTDDSLDRPRRNSMPSQCRQNLSLSYNDLIDASESNDMSLRRVRSFKTTSKGVVNRGDSYKKRPQRERTLSSVGLLHDENTDPKINGHTESAVKNDIAIEIKADDVNLNPSPADYTVVVLGPPGVGKASLTTQFMTSEYIGVSENSNRYEEERTISVLLDGEESTLNFINPVVDEFDIEETPVDAYIVVFSTNDRHSFEVAVDTLHQLRNEFAMDKAIILVANKIDLVRTRHVTVDEARTVASQFDCKYAETSAALNHHVDELLVGILSQIRLKNDPEAVEFYEAHKKPKERRGSFSVAKGLLSKLFRKGSKKDKSCDNLYQL